MSAVLAYRLRLAAAALLAGVTLLGAIAIAIPFSLPTGNYPGPLPLAPVTEARALEALAAPVPRLEEAADLTRETLAQRPMDAMAWSRLAWIAAEQGKTREMLEALDRSYAVAPFGPEVTAWRLRFAYGRWSQLTPELRQQATAELEVTVRTRPRVVSAALADVTDPAGRLALSLGQARVQAEQRRARALANADPA